jgi:branched-subunit amino acid transport protein
VSTTTTLIVASMLATVAIKAVVPLILGGRELPARFNDVIVLLGPALLTALVVTQALANGTRLGVDATTAGVAAGGLVAWRGGSPIRCVVVAAAVTALIRAVA